MNDKEQILADLKEIGCCGGDFCMYDHDGDLQQFVSTALDTYAKQQVEEFKQSIKQKIEEMEMKVLKSNSDYNKGVCDIKNALLSLLSPDQVDNS